MTNEIENMAKELNVNKHDVRCLILSMVADMRKDKIHLINDLTDEDRRNITLTYLKLAVDRYADFSIRYRNETGFKEAFNMKVFIDLKKEIDGN